MRIGLLFATLMWVVLYVYLTGCGSSAGWRVSFGVAPVTAIEDKQQLKEAK